RLPAHRHARFRHRRGRPRCRARWCAVHAAPGDRGPAPAFLLARRRGGGARTELRAGLSRAQRPLPGAQRQQRRAGFLRDARRGAGLAARHQQSPDPRPGAGPARAAPRDQPARQPRRAHNAGHLALHPVLVGRLASAQRVVHMVPAAVKRTLVSILVLVGSGLWVAALLIMAQTVQQSAHFSDLHPFIVGVNVAGLLVLPLLLVFYFSVMFLNRGIDSWFHVEIREGLQDALTLSRAALDIRMREYMQRTRTIATDIASRDEAVELTLYGANRSILGTSSERFGQIVPPRANEEMVMQTRHEYVTLDPVAGGGFLVRTAVQVPLTSPGDEPRMLEAVYPVERRLGELADTVESAYQRYGEKARLREPLKTSFTLTLTLVLLLSLFAALYGAFWAARRLVRPIQDLVAGTRAVAKGDFDMRLPLTSHDEMGILVHSFNDMTKRLARAREETRRSQHAVEAERANLAVILARLSTGAISLEPDHTVRTANQAA